VHRSAVGTAALLLGLLLLRVPTAWAQEIGTVAALEGSAKIGRGTVWITATIGAAIQQGDELRTESPGRLRIVFQDDSVLTMSDDSRVVVDQQVFRPQQGKAASVLELLQGKVSALVSEYYGRPGTAYEIRTATAVAGVRGTDFIVTYDPRDDVTEVAGLSGRIEVRSIFDRTGRGVLVTAGEVTSVPRGRFPSPPRRLSDTLFRQYIEGIDFIGASGAGSLTAGHPILSGSTVPPPDRAGAAVSAAKVRQRTQSIRERRDASDLIHQPPAVFGPQGKLRIDLTN